LTIEKHDWPVVMRKSGGQLSINGVKLFSMTIHKLVMSRTSVYIYGRNVEKDGDRIL
jgi:hypothetical protein